MRSQVAARALGLALQWLPTRKPDDFPGAFASLAQKTVSALLVWPSPMFLSERQRLVHLAAQHRLMNLANQSDGKSPDFTRAGPVTHLYETH